MIVTTKAQTCLSADREKKLHKVNSSLLHCAPFCLCGSNIYPPMLEKKPIKRSGHIVKLSKDHHLTLLFCWKIRSGLKLEIAPERIIKYVYYFWQYHMQPHFTEEETILFAPVNDAAVQKALDEHAQIAEQIKALNSIDGNAVHQLSVLADTVDQHVRYEERTLFPHLEKALSNEQLNNIGKLLAAHHALALKDDFADEFWLKNENSL